MTPIVERSRDFRRPPRGTARRRPRRLLRLLGYLLRASLMLGALGGVALWALTSPVFGLSQVEIEGASRVPEAWVREQLAPWHHRNLLVLDLQTAQRRLAHHRWVRAVELEKVLPDRLVVRLIEYQPVALLVSERGAWFVDDEGRRIAVADDTSGAWLVLRAVRDGDAAALAQDQRGAIELASELATRMPLWREQLTEIELLGDLDLGLRFDNPPYRVLVHADTALSRIGRLGRLLPFLEGEGQALEEIDLRFSNRILLRSLAVRRHESGPLDGPDRSDGSSGSAAQPVNPSPLAGDRLAARGALPMPQALPSATWI